MATTMSEKPSSSSSPPQWVHDVFLSFRGTDTRNNFTAHLHAALIKRGIKAYIDNYDLTRGNDIETTLWKAIKESMFSIVVFSKGYASSPWCLDELIKIVQYMKEIGHTVLPAFYDVDPSDVAEQSEDYKKAFVKHEEDFKEDMQKVQNWRHALCEVSNISGWDVRNRNEAEIIKEIVDRIWNELSPTFPSFDKDQVGLDSRVEIMLDFLNEESKDVRMIGICGMGGIGKSTIARVVYDRLRWRFERSCFLEKVRERFEQNGPLLLQEQLGCKILVEWNKIQDSYRRITELKNRLPHQSVLIVLDDVDQIKQLEMLAVKHDWFGPGSRIIITSRDKHILEAYGVDRIYEPEVLNNDEALLLFSRKAFKQDQPIEGYWEMSKSVMAYAQGLPLALEVLGSFLRGRSISHWKSAINRLNKGPYSGISNVLQISFDGLQESEKKIFLDIAYFFKGMDKDYVTRMLNNCGLDADIGVQVLIEKYLVRVVENALEMHDLLQQMGREIGSRECLEEPGRRSRLWAQKDIFDVLRKNTGREKVEGIILVPPDIQEAQWNMEAFSKLTRLRVLIIHNVHFAQGPSYLSDDLVLLNWHAYPSKSLPSCFQPHKLVELDMQYSRIKQLWRGIKSLDNLKVINVSHSQNLRKTPDFTSIPYLERLILEGCTKLTEVHPSFGLHKKLVYVNLADCKNLRGLPSSLQMESLEILILRGCSKLKKFPDIVGNMKCFQELHLDGSSIQELPLSFQQLAGLVTLTLNDRKNLESLPSWINSLKSLKTLELSGCSKLGNLPENLGEVDCLEKLDVSGTAIIKPPVSIFRLAKLKELSFSGVKGKPSNSMPNFFQNLMFPFGLMAGKKVNLTAMMLPPLSGLSCLTELDLSYCNLTEGTIPSDLGYLSSLGYFNLSGNDIVSLPESIIQLSRLARLRLDDCKMLQSLPELPEKIEVVSVNGCTSLEKLTDPIQLCNLRGSWFSCFNCPKLFDNNGCDDEDRAVTMLKRYLQGRSCANSRFNLVFPVSKISNWFSHRSIGSSVSIQTPRNLHHTCEWKGIAISVAFGLHDFPTHLDESFIGCKFKIGGRYSDWRGLLFKRTIDRTRSDHVWLSYFSSEFFMSCGIEYFDGVRFVSNISEISIDEVRFMSNFSEISFMECGAREVYWQDVIELYDGSISGNVSDFFQESGALATSGVVIEAIDDTIDDVELEGCSHMRSHLPED